MLRGGRGGYFLQVQGAVVVALNGCVGVGVDFLGGGAFPSGLGGNGLSLDFGSGMSRWGDRSLLSIIQDHFFSFVASLIQYFRDPKWSM